MRALQYALACATRRTRRLMIRRSPGCRRAVHVGVDQPVPTGRVPGRPAPVAGLNGPAVVSNRMRGLCFRIRASPGCGACSPNRPRPLGGLGEVLAQVGVDRVVGGGRHAAGGPRSPATGCVLRLRLVHGRLVSATGRAHLVGVGTGGVAPEVRQTATVPDQRLAILAGPSSCAMWRRR